MINRINAGTPKINTHVERQGMFRPLAARLGFMAATAFSALPLFSCTNAPSEMCKGSSAPSNTGPLSMGAAPASVKEADLVKGLTVKWEAASPVLNCDGSVTNMQLTVHWPTGDKNYAPTTGNRFIIEESFTKALPSAVTGDLSYYNPNDGSVQVMKNAATLWPFAVEKKGEYATGCYDANPKIEGNIDFSVEPTNLKAGDTASVSIPKSMVRSCAIDGNVIGSFRLDTTDLTTSQEAKYSAELPALTAGSHVLYFFATETTVKDLAPAVIAKYFSIEEAPKTACDYDPNPKILGNIAISKDPANIYVGDEVVFSIPESNIEACGSNLVVTYRINNEDFPAVQESGVYKLAHTFAAVGNQKIFLIANDPTLSNPIPPYISTDIYVKEVANTTEAPLAGLTGPTWGYAGQELTFSAANPDEAVYSYNWSYSDGSSDIGASSTKIFTLSGNSMATYKVKLTVARNDNQDLKDSVEQQITIIPAATTTPLVGISAPPSAKAGLPINLSAIGADEQLFSYLWEFPDNDNKNGANVQKTFVNNGTMQTITFRLTATSLSDQNIKASAEQTITVIPPALTPPLAGISAPASAVSGNAVALLALNPDTNLYDYSWSFSDGSSDIGPTVSKIFTLPNNTMQTMKINLLVTRKDDQQISDSAEQVITIVPPSVTPLQLSANIPTWATVNTDVNMSVLNADTANWNYLWNFGDNTTAVGAAATHQYLNANDKYTVLLTATSKSNPDQQYFLTDYIKIVP